MAKAISCCRKADFAALIRTKLDPYAFRGSAMAYGCRNEGKAKEVYLTLLQPAHAGLTCPQVGFIVNPSKSWLGASPDGLVDGPSCNQPDGLLEIKCPYVARNVLARRSTLL